MKNTKDSNSIKQDHRGVVRGDLVLYIHEHTNQIKQIIGFINEDGITLNANSAKALNKVVGHEITHAFEGTELYESLSDALIEHAKVKGEYDSRLKEVTEIYKG